jgi:pyruvate-formate lyase-activating enzyme
MPDLGVTAGGIPAHAAAIPELVASGPVLVFGGPYSNLQATRALLAEAQRRGIPPSHMICTGDVAAYGADPAATLALIRDAGITTIAGNCEEQLAEGAGDCGCGFAPGSACDRLAAGWFAHADRALGPADRAWMAALPGRVDLRIGRFRLAVIHAAPSRINRFVFASTPDAELAAELDRVPGADGVIAGHCGLPFTRAVGHRLWHNAGAIGLPADDGTPRTWFSVIEPDGDALFIRHLPLAYDHASAAAAMRAAGLGDYAEAVAGGIWPSHDVLPPTEKSTIAAPLAPRAHRWPGAIETPAPPSAPIATVAFEQLETLWVNTGTRCNLACGGCYIESSPRNDSLAYFREADLAALLATAPATLATVGFTGGEPFLNPDLPAMLADVLARGLAALVLTNAMRPMRRHEAALTRLKREHGARLALRVSLDHFTAEGHEALRGRNSFAPALAGLAWLSAEGFSPSVAARLPAGEDAEAWRENFAALFAARGLAIDATDPARLVLFPELHGEPPPAIPEPAYRALVASGIKPMCATSRMAVLPKDGAPALAACTLLPSRVMGTTLAEAAAPITLDHPHCARFCLYGAASCAPAGTM